MKENQKPEFVSSKSNFQDMNYYHNGSPWAIRLFDALNLITIGIVLLMNTTGVVSWKIWPELLRFWPLFLVSAGISLIFSFSYWSKIVGKALGYLIFLLMLFLAGLNTVNNSTFLDGISGNFPGFVNTSLFGIKTDNNDQVKKTTFLTSDYPSIADLSLKMEFGKGVVNISDKLSDNSILKVLSIYKNEHEAYSITSSILNNSKMIVDLDNNDYEPTFFLFDNSFPTYDVLLSKSLKKVDLNIKLAAGKASLDVSEVKFNSLKADTSAGEMDVTFSLLSLPDTMDLKVAAGSMDLTLPKEAGYKINYNVSVGDFKINNSSVGNGLGSKGTDTSDNYFDAKIKTEIIVNVSAGSLNLTYK